MRKNLQLNPQGDGLAFLAMISWGCYSALIKKIGEWEYPIVAVTRRVYFYGILFLIPVLIRFPDYELPTSDIAPYSQFGAVIFFSCFETNLSDEDIWTIVEIIINDDDSDRELLYTKMRKKAAEENNRFYILENL